MNLNKDYFKEIHYYEMDMYKMVLDLMRFNELNLKRQDHYNASILQILITFKIRLRVGRATGHTKTAIKLYKNTDSALIFASRQRAMQALQGTDLKDKINEKSSNIFTIDSLICNTQSTIERYRGAIFERAPFKNIVVDLGDYNYSEEEVNKAVSNLLNAILPAIRYDNNDPAFDYNQQWGSLVVLG